LESLPNYSMIGLYRGRVDLSLSVFQKDSAGLNRFTVFETLASAFDSPGGSAYTFPDLLALKLSRPLNPKTGERRETPLRVLNAAGAFDCERDQILEFGDLLYVREREHSLNELPAGLESLQRNALLECVQRKVTFVVKGQSYPIKLAGIASQCYLTRCLELNSLHALLRSTSDIFHLEVKRKGVEQPIKPDVESILANTKPLSDDLWLLDGDIITVPEKPGS
jgi:hypothetical protein